MDSRLWIRKALSMCVLIATIATYSMVALANSEKIAGEILVNSTGAAGQNSFVKVNGETIQSGRSIFSASTIATPENAGAIVSLGKLGKIELAPNTILSLSFDEKGISGNLTEGRLTVLNATDSVVINTADGKTATLNVGDSASSANAQTTDTTSDNNGGSAGFIFAAILGGAALAIIVAARTNNNRTIIGGGSSVISPTR